MAMDVPTMPNVCKEGETVKNCNTGGEEAHRDDRQDDALQPEEEDLLLGIDVNVALEVTLVVNVIALVGRVAGGKEDH